MTEQGAAPEESKGGGKFKTVLLILIVILVGGVGIAFYLMMPESATVLEPYQWPIEEEPGLEVSTTLGDSSAMLMTQVRFVTQPIDEDQLLPAETEFKEKRSIIDNILTEVGNSLDSETSLDPAEFKRRVRKMMNDELTHCEIDKILIKDWIIHSVN